MGDIGSGGIYAHYCKLSNKIKSNKIERVEPDTFVVVSDLAKFSQGGF